MTAAMLPFASFFICHSVLLVSFSCFGSSNPIFAHLGIHQQTILTGIIPTRMSATRGDGGGEGGRRNAFKHANWQSAPQSDCILNSIPANSLATSSTNIRSRSGLNTVDAVDSFRQSIHRFPSLVIGVSISPANGSGSCRRHRSGSPQMKDEQSEAIVIWHCYSIS